MEVTHLFSMSYQFGSPAKKTEIKSIIFPAKGIDTTSLPKPETPVVSLAVLMPITPNILPKSQAESQDLTKETTQKPVESIKQITIITQNIFDSDLEKQTPAKPKILEIHPKLSLELPDQLNVKKAVVKVKGKVIDAKTIYINGREVWANDKGIFYEEFPLVKGFNKLTIKATSRTGQSLVKTFKVYRM